jgi:hypothetical protein
MKRKAFLLKLVLLFVTMVYSGNIRADKPRVKGYYINKQGEIQNVLIEVRTNLLSEKLYWPAYQVGFNYIDKTSFVKSF